MATKTETAQPDLIQLVLSGEEVDAPTAQRAMHQARQRAAAAHAEIQELKRKRPVRLVDGTAEEVRELDEALKLAEVEAERMAAIIERIQPVLRRAEKAVELEKAERLAKVLPELLEKADRAQGEARHAVNAAVAAARSVVNAGGRLDGSLRTRLEHLAGGPLTDHGIRVV